MSTNVLNIPEGEGGLAILCILFIIARELVWKAVALYKAGQRSEKFRFICIFILNTGGILPIIYLLLNKK